MMFYKINFKINRLGSINSDQNIVSGKYKLNEL